MYSESDKRGGMIGSFPNTHACVIHYITLAIDIVCNPNINCPQGSHQSAVGGAGLLAGAVAKQPSRQAPASIGRGAREPEPVSKPEPAAKPDRGLDGAPLGPSCCRLRNNHARCSPLESCISS
jgi:hypothetical protein